MLLNTNILPGIDEEEEEEEVVPEEKIDDRGFDLEIKKIETAKNKIEQRPLMKADIIPRHPSSVIFSGSSGSGKSTLLLNLLTREEFYGGYFDDIHLFSPTGGSDDLFKALKLKDENIHLDMKVSDLSDLLQKQKDEIEKHKGDTSKAKKLLVIFEDCQSNGRFMRSKPFLQSFIANRHYGMSTYLCGQAYKRTPKACRLQANNIFYFKGSNSENELMAEEYSPPGMRKRDFMKMLDQGTRGSHNFVHINKRASHEDRYRRNLATILDWNVKV
jgi:hypothetical protein